MKKYNVNVYDRDGNNIAYHKNLKSLSLAIKRAKDFEEKYSMKSGENKIPCFSKISIEIMFQSYGDAIIREAKRICTHPLFKSLSELTTANIGGNEIAIKEKLQNAIELLNTYEELKDTLTPVS